MARCIDAITQQRSDRIEECATREEREERVHERPHGAATGKMRGRPPYSERESRSC